MLPRVREQLVRWQIWAGLMANGAEGRWMFESDRERRFHTLRAGKSDSGKSKGYQLAQNDRCGTNVVSVLALQREVGNGGYDQFFRNASRRFAPAIIADLIRIGCTEIADITQTALDSLNLAELSVPAIEAARISRSRNEIESSNAATSLFTASEGCLKVCSRT